VSAMCLQAVGNPRSSQSVMHSSTCMNCVARVAATEPSRRPQQVFLQANGQLAQGQKSCPASSSAAQAAALSTQRQDTVCELCSPNIAVHFFMRMHQTAAACRPCIVALPAICKSDAASLLLTAACSVASLRPCAASSGAPAAAGMAWPSDDRCTPASSRSGRLSGRSNGCRTARRSCRSAPRAQHQQQQGRARQPQTPPAATWVGAWTVLRLSRGASPAQAAATLRAAFLPLWQQQLRQQAAPLCHSSRQLAWSTAASSSQRCCRCPDQHSSSQC
jgi:hypothetical protein